MANKEVVTVLTVKTEQSQNTIKGLKQEIADLKKKLDNAVIGTDEFEQASKELATAQANLKTVLADGKKTTDAVEGSYNHLVATMAELKKEWKATADEVKRNDLGQQIEAINTKLKDMDASTGNFQRNVGDYANQFKEAFDEQQQSTQNARLGLDGLQKTAAGLASGYAAVQGAMNLLNIENSNFEKAMIKVQSAMAIAQGIGGMKDLIEGAGTLKVMFGGAITSVKGFIKGLSGVKKAILATGIGLFVVALGTMVAYWDDLTAAVERWVGVLNQGAEKLNEVNAQQGYLSNNAIKKQKELNREIKKMQANGATEIEIAEKRLQLIKETKEEQEKFVAELEKQYNDAKWYQDNGYFLTHFQKTILAEYPEIIKKGKEFIDQYREQWLDATTDVEVAIIKANRATTGTVTTTSGETFNRPKTQGSVLNGKQIEFKIEEKITDEHHQKMLEKIKAFNEEQIRLARLAAEQKKALKREEFNTVMGYTSQTLEAFISTTDKETTIAKTAAIAKATIDTYLAANSVLAQQQGGLAAKIAGMIAVISAGIANVVNITKVNTNNPNNRGVGAMIPNINITDSMPIQYTRQLLTDSETSDLNKERTVVVLESEISDVQNRVKVKESNSSF